MTVWAIRYAQAFFCAAALAHAGAARSQPVEPSVDELVLVRLTIPTVYGDSTQNLERVKRVMELLPPRVVTSVKAPSALIRDQYKFGSRNSEKAYRLFQDKLLGFNGTDDSTKLPAGRILVPQAPQRSLDAFNPGLSRNKIARMVSLFPTDLTTFRAKGSQASRVVFRESATLDRGATPTTPNTVVFAWLPRDVVDRNLEIFNDPTLASAVGQDLFVRPAIGCPGKLVDEPPISAILTDAQHASITSLVGRAVRNSTVLVLDSGWPGSEKYVESAEVLGKMLAEVRLKYKLPEGRFPGRKEIAATRAEISADAHTQLIAASVQEFTQLDPETRIKVIYLPYDPELPGTRAILSEMLEILKWSEALGDEFGKFPPSALSDFAQRQNDIRKQVAAILDRVAVKNAELRKISPVSGKYTSWSILKAAQLVIDRYAKSKQTAGFINVSWTTSDRPISYNSNENILVVAAAGNDNYAIDDPEKSIYLAQRGLAHGDTLVVMNGGQSGRFDGSSCISEKKLAAAYAVTFDGRVGSSSGTSFAAPRVAWLLALRETLRAGNAGTLWQSETRDWVGSLRRPDAGGEGLTWFDPELIIDALREPSRPD